MSWETDERPRNHNAWAIPKSEVIIHKATAAVEDLNIYPENLSLLPTLIQIEPEVNWQLQSVNLNTEWIQDSRFYAVPDGWLDNFYAVPLGWIDGFYSVLGGWIENSGFYAVPGGWSASFYPVLGGWTENMNFYAVPDGWTDFYAVSGGWLDGFYVIPDGWYLRGDAGEGITNAFPFLNGTNYLVYGYGDSLTTASVTGLDYLDFLPNNWTVVDAGVDNEFGVFGTLRLLFDIPNIRRRSVLCILWGTNDVFTNFWSIVDFDGVSWQDTLVNRLIQCVDSALYNDMIPVFMLPPPQITGTATTIRSNTRIEIIEPILQAAMQSRGVPFLNLYREFLSLNNISQYFTSDGIHFSMAGSQVVAALIKDVLNT